VVHALRAVLAPTCVPVFTSDGLRLYFYALTAHFGRWMDGGRWRRWQVDPTLLYGQVQKGYRGRRLARIIAFQTLYEMDVSRHRPGEVLQRLLDEQQPAPEAGAFARELVTGVLRHRAQIDASLQEHAPAYPLAQMSPIDRNILRIAAYECLYTTEQAPVRVAINEAVELAKRYGSDSTPRFVNGVLGQIVRQRDSSPPPTATAGAGVGESPRPDQIEEGRS